MADKPKDVRKLQEVARQAVTRGDWRTEMAVKMDIENALKGKS